MSAGRVARRLSDGDRKRRAVVEPAGEDSTGLPWSFSGRVVVEQSWREVAWPLAAVATPSVVALAAFWASASPRLMVWTGTALGVVSLVLDHRYGRSRPGDVDRQADSADAVEPVEPVTPAARWGWSCPVCVLDSVPGTQEVEAADLAAIHDELHHGGRPSAWVWVAGPASPRSAPSGVAGASWDAA